ncbi:MAG TPA: glutaredoxin family protein [Anaerolineales bacterium]|nr:glutaredoxin family protein [Anaerolineales bacterium]
MLNVILYTRAGCHLCEDVKTDLESLQAEVPHKLVEIDIAADEALEAKYGSHIPVIQVGPYQRRAPITRQDLLVSLSAARDRENQLTKLDDGLFKLQKARNSRISTGDRISFWLSNHYLLLINLLVLLYVGLPFLAPVLMKAGWTAPAGVIYKGYSFVCHNLGYRSWFLFGEQPAYPRAAAGIDDLKSFGEATGLSESNSAQDVFAARTFVGNETVGYKVAFCERDVAIYMGILFFGLLYAVTNRRIPALHWLFWLIVGLGPIGLDGFSQLLSQPPFSLWIYRESTPLLRTLTGAVFGFMTAWYGFPLVDETMRDARRALVVKFKRLGETDG